MSIATDNRSVWILETLLWHAGSGVSLIDNNAASLCSCKIAGKDTLHRLEKKESFIFLAAK